MSDYIYVYALILAKEVESNAVPTFTGIDSRSKSYTIKHGEIVAVVSRVHAKTFAPSQIEQKRNDSEWLEEKGFHHHESISLLHKEFTLIPLAFGTVFSNENEVKAMLTQHAATLQKRFAYLSDKQEWNVKIYCNTQAVEQERERSFQAIHQHLRTYSCDCRVRRNWSKGVTGRKDDMVGNVDYLVSYEQVRAFWEVVKLYQQEAEGWSLSLTGPWPPYHFATLCKEELQRGTEATGSCE